MVKVKGVLLDNQIVNHLHIVKGGDVLHWTPNYASKQKSQTCQAHLFH